MYYEMYGEGKPLVLMHGSDAHIQANFERIIPLLAKNRKAIAMELQAHGRTGDRNRDLSFEQDADDVAALLKNLSIDKADFFGFNNGATAALQIAIRHPEIVDKMILGSPQAKRSAFTEEMYEYLPKLTLNEMPPALRAANLKVLGDSSALQNMHDKDVARMTNFKDISDEMLASIKAPTLIVMGDQDAVRIEHALEIQRKIPNARLAVIPGPHGGYIGDLNSIGPNFNASDLPVVVFEKFLNKKTDTNTSAN